MFGSNMPRFEEMRMLAALKDLVYGGNRGTHNRGQRVGLPGREEQAWLG